MEMSPLKNWKIWRAMSKKRTYPLTEPVDSIFAEIDDLANLARLAKSPLTKQQQIHFEYLILQHLHPYGSTLTRWNERDAIDKTWNNFKKVFRTAKKNLQKTDSYQ